MRYGTRWVTIYALARSKLRAGYARLYALNRVALGTFKSVTLLCLLQTLKSFYINRFYNVPYRNSHIRFCLISYYLQKTIILYYFIFPYLLQHVIHLPIGEENLDIIALNRPNSRSNHYASKSILALE